jgi:predicted nucleic acid-binding Zn ribbon protein
MTTTHSEAGERHCDVCLASIDHLRADARTCGGACRAEASRRRRGVEPPASNRECAYCGGEITSRRADAAYCSGRCKRLAARERAENRQVDGEPVIVPRPSRFGVELAAMRTANARAATTHGVPVHLPDAERMR